MAQKRVLVPNGNYTDIRLIKALKKLGLYVITSGNAPELEGHKYADEYVPYDYSDYEGMLELAKTLNLNYISACSNDIISVRTCSLRIIIHLVIDIIDIMNTWRNSGSI